MQGIAALVPAHCDQDDIVTSAGRQTTHSGTCCNHVGAK